MFFFLFFLIQFFTKVQNRKWNVILHRDLQILFPKCWHTCFNFFLNYTDDINVVDAACKGAVVGMQLVLNITANLIAFLALIEMINQLIIYLGARVDVNISLFIICEYLFFPFAWLMGVDPEDCRRVGNVIGLKIIANEVSDRTSMLVIDFVHRLWSRVQFVAYDKLRQFKDEISPRSFYIASYALAGFSNLSSIGIQLGGLTPLAPNQGKKLAKLGFSAMVAGNTACFMTACIAGIFYEENS